MSDERLREAERRWRMWGSVESGAALLRDRLRLDTLRLEHVEAAAFLGSRLAADVAPSPWSLPSTDDPCSARLQRVPQLGIDVHLLREWACRCAERVLPLFELRSQTNRAPRRAIEAARACRDLSVLKRASDAAYAAAGEVSQDRHPAAWGAAQAAGAAARPELLDVLPIYAAHDAQVAATGSRSARRIEARWQVMALIELLLEPNSAGRSPAR